jgi:Mrp family chromosome partitioning ATPase
MRLPSRAQWLGARATNVLRRKRRIAEVAVPAFLAFLAAYLLAPAGVKGVRGLLVAEPFSRPDTTFLARQAGTGAVTVARAESALAAARQAALARDSDTAHVRLRERSAKRDTLVTTMARLTQLLLRASNAPLPESYEALAREPFVAEDPTTQRLSDTLAAIVRRREALGGRAAVDPLFVALSTRLNAVGRSIQAIGSQKLDSLRAELRGLPVAEMSESTTVSPGLVDTLVARTFRDSVQRGFQRVSDALAHARRAYQVADSVESQRREGSRLATVPVLTAAALVLSVFVALVILMADEMRSPRVADPIEAERLTHLRVLSRIQRPSRATGRDRRQADRTLTPVLDPSSDEYRMIVWHLAADWPRDGIVTVAGDEPLVTGCVGANLAAVLANDARVTLLVDTQFDAEPVRHLLAMPRSPGLAAVVDNRRRWSESIVPVHVGRSRTMDVLPSGSRERPLGPSESQALASEIARAAQRHDAAVVVASTGTAIRARAGDHVIICAREGHTRLATLGRAVTALIDTGARVQGIVLWAAAARWEVRGSH